jgi:hypothetical protein
MALKVKNSIEEKIAVVRRNKELYEDMKMMNSTMEEIEQLKNFESVNNDEETVWFKKIFEREKKILEQFEKDNIWYIDKRSWNSIKKENISIFSNGVNLAKKSYNEVKIILRRGIRITYSSMMKIRKFVPFSVVDSIYQGRANRVYFQLLKNLEMFNRFKNLENWMLGRNWKEEIVRRVKHKHFMGNNYFKLGKSNVMKPFAVIIPDSPEFEIIKNSYVIRNEATQAIK